MTHPGDSSDRGCPAADVMGRVSRRSFLGASVTALGLAATGCDAGPSARTARTRLQLRLFPPTGQYPVGTVPLHLVDHSRRDPWIPTRPRELMVSIWYPTLNTGHYARASWIPEAAGALFLGQLIESLAGLTGKRISPHSRIRVPQVSLHGVRLPVTQARLGTPVDLSAQRYPVLIYQPGYGDVRELGTGLVSDLASRGYVVVTMDDTYEAAEVEFPDGRIAVPRRPSGYADTVRIADTRFVLDVLKALESGVNPDVEHRPLPSGLTRALDLKHIGMFGHSLGGATAAKAMAADDRIGAGIDLDGSLFLTNPSLHTDPKKLGAAVARQLGDRPFMIMSSHGFGPRDDPSWSGFWPNLRGPRRFLTMQNSQHHTYTDLEEFLSQLLAAKIIPHKLVSHLVTPAIGTINPVQAIAAERAYISAFFDMYLRGQATDLLNHPSPRYPEIEFLGT